MATSEGYVIAKPDGEEMAYVKADDSGRIIGVDDYYDLFCDLACHEPIITVQELRIRLRENGTLHQLVSPGEAYDCRNKKTFLPNPDIDLFPDR